MLEILKYNRCILSLQWRAVGWARVCVLEMSSCEQPRVKAAETLEAHCLLRDCHVLWVFAFDSTPVSL